MATKKKLLQAAAGSASGGAGGLNVEDVFSTYLYEANGTFQVNENGINLGQSNDGGSIGFNLDSTTESATATDDTDYISINSNSIINFGTGDFTIEFWTWLRSYGTNEFADFIGSGTAGELGLGVYAGTLYYGPVQVSNILSTSFTSYVDKWTHVALVRSSGTSKIYLDGTEAVSASDGTNWASTGGLSIGRYGTRIHGVQGYMSNVRVVKGTAVYTSNFTPSTSALTAVSGTELLVAQGSTPFVDNSANGYTVSIQDNAKASTFGPFDAADAGEGGLVWIKNRDNVEAHYFIDTERGTSSFLKTTSIDGASTYPISQNPDYNFSFNSNGFSIYDDSPTVGETLFTGRTYASWTWRKAPKFFTCLTYTGTGTAQNISHDLGTTVGTLIVKRTDSSDNWTVWHRGVNSGSGSSFLNLNLTSGYSNSATRWNSTSPTSTQFSVGTHASVNASGGTYVAYLFAHNDGDGEFGPDGDADIIKCGSYTGNGSSTGPEIDLGFEPQWVLWKNANRSDASWAMLDNMRGINTSSNDPVLVANTSGAEWPNGNYMSLTPTGFKITTTETNTNASGDTHIYIAIRRGPMAVPTDATEVFAQGFAPSSGEYIVNAGFPVDAVIYTATGGLDNYNFDRMRGNPFLLTNTTAAESASIGAFDSNTSFRLAGFAQDSSTYINWMWKRAPSYFDVVAYSGNGVAGRTVPHNLGVAPDMMWVKRRNLTEDFFVYHGDLGASYNLRLNKTLAANNQGNFPWNATAPTDSVFTVYNDASTNGSGSTYIAYLFASVDGVSKVGSVSHTYGGGDTNVNCGFSSGARFVLLKRSDNTGDWVVWDTERGIVAGNDPYLLLNSTAAENSSYDLIDPYSSGFTLPSNSFATGDYIFYAIA